LQPADLPVWADVVAAAVISTEPSGVQVTGLGQSSEPYAFGDRQLGVITSLQLAAQRARADADLPSGGLDLVEVDGLTLIEEALGLEAIGFAPPGQGFELLASDGRCNPSGGGAAGYSPPSMGLTRIVEAVLQLRGLAGAIQVPSVRRAMATGSSTVAGQTQTAIILEAA
jgi:acetyl-CoA C-acetyltransferase